ncbi:hypothetical protein PRO82_001450 [Candidatus Protochlamydia amoebophila]|nr:hypothetical protein [Candidatus Protochlamydia amoebophila]
MEKNSQKLNRLLLVIRNKHNFIILENLLEVFGMISSSMPKKLHRTTSNGFEIKLLGILVAGVFNKLVICNLHDL